MCIFFFFSSTHGSGDRRLNEPNTALLCTILALGTFFIAYYLRHFRNSKFLGRNVSITVLFNLKFLLKCLEIIFKNSFLCFSFINTYYVVYHKCISCFKN